MNCEQVQNSFVDYQAGTLPPADAAQVRSHLTTCLACQREWAGLQETLLKLDRLPADTPSPRMREQFYAMLETHQRLADGTASPFQAARSRLERFFESILPQRPSLQFALSATLLVFGLFIGARIYSSHTPAVSSADQVATQRELADLRKKVDSIDQLMAYQLAQKEPANDRLKTVLSALDRGSADEKTLTQLLGTLAFDPSTNVRLSALEALYAHADKPLVRNGVLASLPRESSPLVQLAMIDFLASVRDRNAAPTLEALTRTATVDKTVREAANRALAQL